MMKAKLLIALLVGANFVYAANDNKVITWTAVFDKTSTIPGGGKTQEWCNEHTPSVFITTEKQIKGPGIMSLNGIKVKYNKYVINNIEALSFSTAYATFSAGNGNEAWELPTKIYEQSFSQDDYFTSVWSNQYCRGFMVGYPSK